MLFCFFSECLIGTFGSYCRKKCHCADNSKCSKINGSCFDGKCEKGYTGESCQTSKKINFLNTFSCSSEMNILSVCIHLYTNEKPKIFNDSVKEKYLVFHW